MKADCLHQDINVDDWVVFNPPYYSGLCIGKVTKLTPKGVSVKYGKNFASTCNRSDRDVLRVSEQRKFAMELNPEQFI